MFNSACSAKLPNSAVSCAVLLVAVYSRGMLTSLLCKENGIHTKLNRSSNGVSERRAAGDGLRTGPHHDEVWQGSISYFSTMSGRLDLFSQHALFPRPPFNALPRSQPGGAYLPKLIPFGEPGSLRTAVGEACFVPGRNEKG